MTNDGKVERPPAPQENIADQPPHPTEMWEIRRFVDPKFGIVIEMAISSDVLIPPVFKSSVNVMTNRGPAQIQFDMVDCTTIQEALKVWHANAKKAVEEMKENMKKAERRIILPDVPKAPFPLKPNGGIN